MLSRREFLRRQLGAGALMAFGSSVPAFLASTARAADTKDGEKKDAEKILVVVELTGGNDGLNTVIPYSDDLYQKARPTLRFEKRQVVVLDEHTGLHPSLRPLKELYDKGHLAVVQGVGYPNPNRSHFESMDVWQSADPRGRIKDGWLGRAVGSVKTREGRIPAIHVAGQPLPLAMRGAPTGVPTIHANRSLDLFLGDFSERTVTENGVVQKTDTVPVKEEETGPQKVRRELIRKLAESASPSESSMLQFVRRTSLDTFTTLDRLRAILSDKFEKPEGEFEFKNGRVLSNREGLDYELQLIARLIQADMGSRVYYVALDGFDTHGDQKETHANLLTNLADAVQSFYQTLTESEDAARVVLMTYSEFGRRVEENDSHGTDHGAGSNLFVIGPSVKGGLVGAPPSLKRDDLLSGDLAFHTDFRRVYATLLDNWLGCDSRRVLGEPFEHLKLLA